MAGAYTKNIYPKFITKADLPDTNVEYTLPPKYRAVDYAAIHPTCRRCAKSIASGRAYEKPDHTACDRCRTNRRPG
ncbi:hypothetical protein LTR37_014046 [Vermiconidia calcicola]|uniref:Uncharacterized protein n=1 Tax=Vermiconidia calcicola TaxID=1690605 RepID=A0ACC3MVT3_9PEZI|nr:hypothetical protein LTR37_014046 [Vermiconidia calcicola]